jgi:hypothetical protein
MKRELKGDKNQMLKSIKALVMLLVVIGVTVAVPCLADTWDAYTDFSSVQGTRGWEYGYSTDTTGNANNTYGYATFSWLTSFDVYNAGKILTWHNNDGMGSSPTTIPYPMICQNTGAALNSIAANTMCLLPAKNNGWSITRWTVPAGISGQYTLFAKMGPTPGGATATFSRTSAGTTTQLATSVTMPSMALVYGALITPSAGDVYDFAVGKGGAAPTWQYHPFTIKFVDGNWYQTGKVIDASGAGLPGATVTESGYSVQSGADGTFSMIMFPGIHTLSISKSGYTTASMTTPNITAGGTNVGTATLQLTGTWNAKNDFTYRGNPNGQWRYGTYTGKSLTGYSFQTFTQSGLCEWGSYVQYWSYANVASTATAPTPCIGLNTRVGTAEGVFPKGLSLAGKLNAIDSVVARWVAPAAGYYNITASDGAVGATPAIVQTNGTTYTTLASGNGTIAITKYVVNMAQGEYIDFITQTNSASNAVVIDATIASGAIGLSGYVQDSNNVKIAGAVVKNTAGTETATTDSAGNYTLILASTGTYSINISKPGYDPVTQSVPITLLTLTPQNFTLPVGATISGTITDAFSPNPVLAGVRIVSGDGLYSAVTNSAGAYSFLVTHGTQAFYYTKPGYVGQTIVLPMTGSTVQDLSLTQGWDFASDFSTSNGNPNPVANSSWTYGYDVATDGVFAAMTTKIYNPLATSDKVWLNVNPTQSAFYKNVGQAGAPGLAPLNGAQWREAGSVIASANGFRTIARFSPNVTGNYKVSARWAGVQIAGGTTSSVALRKTTGANTTYLFGDPATSVQQISGFVGRAASGYSDSSGATPVQTFSQTMDIQAGDSVDSIVYAGSGWTQVDLTVAKTATTIKGRVTSDIPGNPPVIEAKVQATGGASSYTAYTDSAGYFSMSVSPDAYDIETFRGGYGVGYGSATVAADQTATANITMHHLGTWDIAQDWTTIANPNGQWSYGAFDQANNNTFTIGTALYSGTLWSTEPAQVAEWLNPAFWPSWIGKNYGTTPAIGTGWNSNPYYYYIEPGDLFMISGNRNAIASIRWTAPAQGAYDIYCHVTNQCGVGPTQAFSVLKNGNVVTKKLLTGFIGTFAANYTDRTGAPQQDFNLTIPLNSGDVVDFAQDFDYYTGHGWSVGWGSNQNPPYSVGIVGSVARNTTIVQCNTAVDLKNQIAAQDVGTSVMMLAPLTVTARADRYADFSTYVETGDRSQGFKLVGDINTSVVAEGWKITFTGTIITDPADPSRKVIQLISVNDQTTGTALSPLGIGSKALTLSGPTVRDKFVRVWGKVTSVIPNTDPTTNTRWPYDYYIINDGASDFKIMMHGQATMMTDPTPMGAATVGHYIAVIGVVVKDGSDIVIFPRGYGSGLADLDDYTAQGS